MVGCVLLTMMQPIVASAAEKSIAFESTDIESDLKGATVNGKPFSFADYPYDENGELRLINFVEYCYSYKANLRDNYGLYVYVYNPQGLNLSTSDKQNKIQMATSFDESGKPTDYVKFSLEFCSKIDSGDHKNLFYKFKVVDKEVDGKTFAERVNSMERRYAVSGIELTKYGAQNAVDYPVNTTYVFTGYAEGYGPDPNAKSTLACQEEQLESVSLDVKHTFYRSESSSLGAGHQNQLDTVYFAVPKRLIEEYGRLQRIKAEWYEYKTKEIAVTSNADFYNAALPYVGTYMGDYTVATMYEYNKNVGYSLGINAGDAGDFDIAKWGWNLGTGYIHPACQRLTYLFQVDDISEYDPYADTTSIGGVTSNALYDYIKSYNKSFAAGTLPIKNGTISADLFESDIDESRKMNNASGVIKQGYSYYDFDADVDLQTLKSWSETKPSFWDNWLNFGLGAAFTGGPSEESRTVAPIQILSGSDISGTNKEVSDRLLVHANDVDAIKAAYNDAVTVSGADDEEKVLVLFRFATSDYYSEEADIIKLNNFLWIDKKITGQAYVAQESVFFDFDIIQLTFNKEGEHTVIPVVASPIDIVNDVTRPVNMSSGLPWWQALLAALSLILLLFILWPVLPQIINFVVWLVLLPFKAIGALFKAMKRKRNPNQDEEE